MQVGWHVEPLARVLVQLPTPPLAGAVDASQSSAEVISEIQMLPPSTTAASLAPSFDDAIASQYCVATAVSSTQVVPEFVEVQVRPW